MRTNENFDTVFSLIVGLVAGILIACFACVDYYQKKAINSGCAEYNQSTGDFQWKNLKLDNTITVKP